MDVHAINLPQTVSVALLVIAGLFGNGEERKNRLNKAGYNPNVVQSCVNELLPIINKYGG
jgi:hypothetical protein